MNPSVLDQKLRALKLYPRLRAADIDRLGAVFPTLGPWDWNRMNPYRFAEQHGFDAEKLLDLFIHAAKIGLLDFYYGQMCPSCGGTEHNHTRLDGIKSEGIHCTVCASDVTSSMDDFIEVSFQPSEALGVEKVDPLANLGNYLRYYRSENIVTPAELGNGVKASFLDFIAIAPDEKGKIGLELKPDETYRLMNMESHSQVVVTVDGAPLAMEQVVDIDLLGRGFSPSELTLRPGKVVFHISNRFKTAAGVATQSRTLFQKFTLPAQRMNRQWKPFLTGKAFLNNQSFRELFRIQAWAPDMKLKIKSLTILFTDLKGSTDMYGRVGDIQAYDVVQKHFDLLTDVVREHHGAIVKTMGDAIMATFSNSQDGVLAALDMVQRMKALNTGSGPTDLGIKIGLHEGAALAVNADDRLDYFGQNINLAARVQGLAEAGEVWMTDAVFTSPGVDSIVTASRLRTETKMATLKGISAPTPVHRLFA